MRRRARRIRSSMDRAHLLASANFHKRDMGWRCGAAVTVVDMALADLIALTMPFICNYNPLRHQRCTRYTSTTHFVEIINSQPE